MRGRGNAIELGATQATDMMVLRREGLDRCAVAPLAVDGPFADMTVRLAPDDVPGRELPRLAAAVARRLSRPDHRVGPGAVLVTGLAAHFRPAAAREFHEDLFRAVWTEFRAGIPGGDREFRIKTGTVADGAIPEELYGSRWSFKDLHVDREVLLFSHLYGPVAGFAGGELLLVDVRPYLRGRGLGFADAFTWSSESTEGSKPVLRPEHCRSAVAECGVDVGPLGPDAIVFVNNMPDAGILHGVRPVEVTDAAAFRREYHRCSVKEVSP
ncbi:hypothetical protein [Kutzneria buriramensis]|uniref:Uncharacterized protein n=1 Tax=Kutzneria buriramensis TaxID=1045776 RepID=A0A3E0GZB1_9PSEU|nr:hypothetical protein [Kutzneria buriramensis]REH35684.1 hypothetical protein BCF44_11772 [Kutzneria buriramensis]